MFSLDYQMAINLLFVALIAYVGIRFAFRKDTEKENRRRAAAQMAQTLSGLGLVHIPKVLTDYSVGDYSGMIHTIQQTAQLFLHGESAVLAEFSKVADRVLEKRLATAEGRAYLASRIAEAKAATTKEPAAA